MIRFLLECFAMLYDGMLGHAIHANQEQLESPEAPSGAQRSPAEPNVAHRSPGEPSGAQSSQEEHNGA